ncbi:MAG: tetraacyldisaccharide 4'-kinase [Paraglaciecola sp.]|jgi:tetraacyldisaccharide 4'-kinase
MIRNTLVKILLSPFSLLYGFGVSLRDFFYRKGLLKGVEFNLPVISVGNLSVGGAGKTPHIEYLIRLTKDYLNVATLSRGYKRKTKGYIEATPVSTAEQVGDEPLQFKRKYPEIMVTVSESRTFGIPEIIKNRPDTEVVLLDDAFQHRSVKPGLNILLTEFHHPFTKDYLLPSGRLREWRSAYQRADVIVVTKCPDDITEEERNELLTDIQPLAHQRVFFSWYEHQRPYYLLNSQYVTDLQKDWDVLLISAIARTDYLVDYLETKVNSVKVLEYADHHFFTNYDISHLKRTFENMPNKKKLILTTEKDAMRLELHKEFFQKNKLPLFVVPVEVNFHFEERAQFDGLVKDFLLNFKV